MKSPRHGTVYAYSPLGLSCRCEACKEAKSMDNAKYNGGFQGSAKGLQCPNCPESFYTDSAYREHWKLVHAKGVA